MSEKCTNPTDGCCGVRPDDRSTINVDQSGRNTPSDNPTQAAVAVRERLPDRRGSEAFQFSHCGVSYAAMVSRFADGRLAEIFIDHSRPNSQLAEHANDAAVLVSLLLQHGVTAAKIQRSISGPLATALAKAERG